MTAEENVWWDRSHHTLETWCAEHGVTDAALVEVSTVGGVIKADVVLPWRTYIVTRFTYGSINRWLEVWYQDHQEEHPCEHLVLRDSVDAIPYAKHVIERVGPQTYQYKQEVSWERAPTREGNI